MKNEQQMVREFHVKAGVGLHDKPTTIDFEVYRLRMNLIEEEAGELEEAFYDRDIVKIADAIGDLLYVTLGAACACGIDIEPIFHEIHRSNMTKFVDGHKRADGKWIKGPSYSPANLGPILEEQSK